MLQIDTNSQTVWQKGWPRGYQTFAERIFDPTGLTAGCANLRIQALYGFHLVFFLADCIFSLQKPENLGADCNFSLQKPGNLGGGVRTLPLPGLFKPSGQAFFVFCLESHMFSGWSC